MVSLCGNGQLRGSVAQMRLFCSSKPIGGPRRLDATMAIGSTKSRSLDCIDKCAFCVGSFSNGENEFHISKT